MYKFIEIGQLKNGKDSLIIERFPAGAIRDHVFC